MKDSTFWEWAERLEALARRNGLKTFDEDARRWRFELPTSFWVAARELVTSEYGWSVDKDPPTGESWPYLVFGYPFVIDPTLPPDGMRLVRR